MAAKTANVTARIQPNIKEQAEAILERLAPHTDLEEVALAALVAQVMEMTSEETTIAASVAADSRKARI